MKITALIRRNAGFVAVLLLLITAGVFVLNWTSSRGDYNGTGAWVTEDVSPDRL